MALSAGLLLKSLGGLLAVATTTVGTWYLITKDQITKFDQGLINYLDNGGDIKFKVAKKDSSGSNYTDITSDSHLTLDTGNNPLIIKVSLKTVGGEGTLTESSSEGLGKTAALKKLNGEKDWTWICEIKLEKVGEEKDKTTIKDEQKKKLFENSNGGLLGILKSDSDNGKKKIKKDFIRNCAKSRSNNKMSDGQEISTSDGDIVFGLKKDSENLVFEDESKFNRWFTTTVSQ